MVPAPMLFCSVWLWESVFTLLLQFRCVQVFSRRSKVGNVRSSLACVCEISCICWLRHGVYNDSRPLSMFTSFAISFASRTFTFWGVEGGGNVHFGVLF